MAQTDQEFLTSLEKKLWTAADKLRSTLDAAQYKHAVLGLVFLKYVSDSFDMRREEVEIMLRNEGHDYGVLRSNYDSDEEYEATIQDELEIRDFYAETNVFWVPQESRWKFLQDNNKAVIGGELEVGEGNTKKKIRSVGGLIDNALAAIERDNPKLKGVLNKRYSQLQIDQAKLGELIDLIATIPFQHDSLGSKDILGHVYEYFLGQFALAEGKKGGQFYTPKAIVTLVVEMLEPFKGRVYDPAMGSGGFFVQSERFIEDNQGTVGDVSLYGQEYNHTTWQLAAMNMAIRGLDFDFGKEPANTFTNDQHPDLRADYVMANPPFNMKEWDTGLAEDDPRWVYGTPPSGNANFAWLQHMLYHLAPNGSLGLLLANGSMSSNTKNEGEIRRALIENDLVECMVALPGQLFTNTQIPACIWFLTKNKKARTDVGGRKHRDRSGEILFIDARNHGYMKNRVLRDFTIEDIEEIAGTIRKWRSPDFYCADALTKYVNRVYEETGSNISVDPPYEDTPGFCKSAMIEELAKHDFVLTPGRYVGAAAEENDGEVFADKMARLMEQLKVQFEEGERLEGQIKENLAGLGFNV